LRYTTSLSTLYEDN